MKVIPVIDILGGVAVHAVRGERKSYQPLKSTLCSSHRPLDVARAFAACGFSELYVADLDAITGSGENTALLEDIAAKTHLKLMVDSGVSDLNQMQKLLDHKIFKVIIGTETLCNLQVVREGVERFGEEKIVVSLDLKEGRVLSISESTRLTSPLPLALELQGMGVSELIVLDLARVGSGEGVDFKLLKDMVGKLKVKVQVGGGVRDAADLTALKILGVAGVLLSTSLHSGRLSLEEIQRLTSAQ